jgi:hypothetical protein
VPPARTPQLPPPSPIARDDGLPYNSLRPVASEEQSTSRPVQPISHCLHDNRGELGFWQNRDQPTKAVFSQGALVYRLERFVCVLHQNFAARGPVEPGYNCREHRDIHLVAIENSELEPPRRCNGLHGPLADQLGVSAWNRGRMVRGWASFRSRYRWKQLGISCPFLRSHRYLCLVLVVSILWLAGSRITEVLTGRAYLV